MDDVLSSVRRLVTNTATSAPDEQDLKSSEKLLLTPALRVETGIEQPHAPNERTETDDTASDPDPVPEAPFVNEPEAPRASAEVLQLGTVAGRAALEERIAELEAAVEAKTGEWEPDGSEAVDIETPRRFVFTHTPRASEEAAALDRDPATDDAGAATGSAEDAELSETPAQNRSASIDAPDQTAGFTVSDAVSRAVREAVEKESRKAVAEISAGAAEVGAQSDASQATPASPDAEPSNHDRPAADHAGEADLSDELLSELAIDEGLLRDMVSEIVRQELQGALGERITRNVRKLVRREIHRAIMTRDFS